MPPDRHVRRHRRVAAVLVGGLLAAGCGSGGDEPAPAPAPAPSSPTSGASNSEIEGTDGIVTSSRKYPEWEAIEGMETPRDDFGSAVVGSEIWTMGGMTGARGNRLVSIEVLDTETGSWRTSDIEMPLGLASFESVAVGREIYAFGGFDADSLATRSSAVLDTRTGDWRTLPELPHARYAHTVTRYDGRIYVIGGRDEDGPVAEVDVFDPRRERWTTLDQPMAHPRDSHKTTATPQGLVVAGGFRDYEDSDLVDRFDPETGRWTSLPDLPEPMSRAGLTYLDGRLWISLHESSYVMDPTGSRTWEEANALTLSRHGMGFVPVDGTIYSIAGCALNPLRDVRTVDRLDLS